MTTYEFYDNGNTIQMIKNVDGKITTTNFNKRNVSVTTGGNPELFEISDLRGSACPYYTEVTIPTSTSLDDLRSQINTWLDNINVEATIEVDSTGLATIVKQDEQIVILNSLDSKLNSLGQKPSSGSAPVVLSTEQEAILEAIKTAVQGIDLDTNGLAKDATLVQTNNLLTAIDLVLDSIDASIDVNLSTRASEATLELARLLLVSIDGKVATENTLLAAKGVLDNLLISTQNIEGYTDGLEALITATNTKLDTIISNTTGLATETTLAGIKSQTDKLSFTPTNELIVEATIDPTGLATEAKQDTQITNQGTEGATPPTIAGTGIIGYLRAIYDKLVIGASSVINFVKDGITTNVEIDTINPANNEPMPTALYNDKGLQGTQSNPLNTAIRDASTGSRMIVDLNGAAKLGEAIILSGDVLYGQALSDFLWYDLSINGGTTFGAAGEQRLETGTTANGEVILQSRKKSRFMISQFNISHFGIQMTPTGNLADPNCITEIGNVTFLDDNGNLNATPNGIFLRVQGDPVTPQWSVVNVKNGVETVTPYASWNGAQVGNFNPSPNLAVYEIQYNAGTAFFFQGSNFVHRLAGGTSTYAATYNFPVALRIRNINGNTNNNSFGSRAAGAYRLGEERGELISRALTVNTLVKTGAGYIGKASLSRTGSAGGAGTALIYDGLNNTGILIGRVDVGGDDVKGITLDGTFSNGLYIEITGSGINTLNINFE